MGALRCAAMPILSPILRPHVGPGLHQAVRDLRRGRDRLGAAKSGRLGSGDPARVLAGAAFYIFVPALLFRTSARIEFERLDVRILLAFFAPTLAVLGAVYLVAAPCAGRPRSSEPARAERARDHRVVRQRGPDRHPAGGGAATAKPASPCTSPCVSLHALTLLTVLTALVELDLARAERRATRGGPRLLRTLATTVRNTVIHPVDPAGARRPRLERVSG